MQTGLKRILQKNMKLLPNNKIADLKIYGYTIYNDLVYFYNKGNIVVKGHNTCYKILNFNGGN